MMNIPKPRGNVPFITTEQMIQVDRAMIDDYQIDLTQMMENAGRNLAHLARIRFFDSDPVGKSVVVLAGSGGNGGGALVCARRLHNYGARTHVIITKADQGFRGVPRQQLRILRRMKIPIGTAVELGVVCEPDLIIDGIIGYSLKGAPRGAAADLIRWANSQPAPVLALDVPSGVDTTTGTTFEPAIWATATMTLALPKEGLRVSGAAERVGELYLADISVPPSLYAEPNLCISVGHIFSESDIVQVR